MKLGVELFSLYKAHKMPIGFISVIVKTFLPFLLSGDQWNISIAPKSRLSRTFLQFYWTLLENIGTI